MEIYREGPRVETSKGPSVKWLWGEKSTEAVLSFLGSTRVGCISVRRKVPEEAAEAEDTTESGSGEEGEEGEEGGPGLPRT